MFHSRRIAVMGGDVFRDEHSLAFDGTDDYIQVAETTYDIDGGTVSFTFWAKLDDTSVQNLVMAKTSPNYAFINIHSNGSLYIESDTNDDAASAPITHDTSWHHYVVSCNSGTVSMYQDGNALAMGDSSVSDDITLSTISYSASKVFNGNISEVAIYNIALSSSQAKTIYNGREPFDHKNWAKTGNLTQWWRMGDGAYDGGYIVTDEANLGIVGEISPNPTFDSNITGWSAYGDDGSGNDNIVAHETTIKKTGAGSIKSTSKGSNAWAFKSGNLTWVANKVYLLTADVYIPDGNTATNLQPRLTDGAGLSGASVEQYILPDASLVDTWQKTSTVFLNASDTGGDEIYGNLANHGSNNDVIYWDNVHLMHLSGNAGVMLNMSFDDIEGDTP